MAEARETLGKRIALARERAGLTQQELAEQIGLRQGQSISRYERGETEVPQKKLRRIAEATRQPLGYFLEVIDDLPEGAEGGAVDWRSVREQLAEIQQAEAQNRELLAELLRIVRDQQEPPGGAQGSV